MKGIKIWLALIAASCMIQKAWGQTLLTSTPTCNTRKLMQLVRPLPTAIIQSGDSLIKVDKLTSFCPLIIRRNERGNIIHAGISLKENNGLQVLYPRYKEFIERILLELLECENENAAVRKLAEFKLKLSFSHIPSNTPRRAVNEFLKRQSHKCDFVQSEGNNQMNLVWKFADGNMFAFAFPLVRELIEGTDKKEADELIYTLLSDANNSDNPYAIPPLFTNDCKRLGNMPLYLLPGNVYAVNGMSSDLYFMKINGKFTAAFSPLYVKESLSNLFLGIVAASRQTLHVNHRQYGNVAKIIDMPLNKFVSYWRSREGYNCYCGVNMKNPDTPQIVLIIVNDQLQYIHILKITADKDVLFDTDSTIPADFITNIPQQNVSMILTQ